jgi:Skp family chaperone for outer membrane proteins
MVRDRFVFGIALFGALMIMPVAFAQTPAAAAAPAAVPAAAGPALVPPTVAVVDMQRVLVESAAGKSIQSQLDAERRKIRDQVTRMEEELKTAQNEFIRKRAVMTPDAANEQQQALQRRQADAQRVLQERQEAFQRGEGDAINVVGDNMRDIVQQIAGERHIGMVVNKQAVISMADKNMDITDDVVQRLNTKLPTVTVTIPAPGAANETSATNPAAAAEKTAPAPKKK